MTSRRGTLVEEGARELLQVHGYTVDIIPPGFNKKFPPAHLVATRPSGETRFIRIRKFSHLPSTVDTVMHEMRAGPRAVPQAHCPACQRSRVPLRDLDLLADARVPVL